MPKILDFIINREGLTLSKNNYGEFCKGKMNKCLLVKKEANLVDLVEE